MDIDVREYNSVVLAALVHDVGKLLHRGNEEYKYKDGHEAASSQFINKLSNKLRNEDLYDIDLVNLLIRCHDTDIDKSAAMSLCETYLTGKADDLKERTWKLIKLVQKADSYSCKERATEKNVFGKRTLPLESVFSYITLDKQQERNFGRYHLCRFQPISGLPVQIPELKDKEITDLIHRFEDHIPDFSNFTSFDDVLNEWINILHEFMWAVPSDTRYKNGISDISLFDHLLSSTAIAACLYKRHRASLEPKMKFDHKNEFIFIGGDFSGIQKYIFDITNKGYGGASKRLRARSFFIYLFSEIVIHKILHSLRLPMVCNIFSAGGKFLILAPNIDGINEELLEAKRQIEKEIHETYFAQFSFLMSWTPIKGFEDEFRVHNFFKVANDMFHAIEQEKVSKSRGILTNTSPGWNESAFMAKELYESYTENGDCPICGKGPATHEEDMDEEGRTIKSCFICYRDKMFLGQKIPKCNYIAFAKGPVSKSEEEQGNKIVLFHNTENGNENNEGYYVELLEHHDYKQEYYLIYEVSSTNNHPITESVPLKKYYANYVLLDANNRVESFEEIAKRSRWEKNQIKYGSDLLGVLKADVDNLGLIFNKGFEIPSPAEEGLPDIDRKTVSRFLTLSRMLELFFSGWMKETMSGDNKDIIIEKLIASEKIDKDKFKQYLKGDYIDFKNIYTVYSGGDDLVLVGPWETMIVFAIFLNQQFREYTCNNKFITISAGLTFVKPKHPIASAIKQADELLERSKKAGKNRITLFGTTVEWKRMTDLINFHLFLNEKMNDDNSEINTAFLHRLIEYHRMSLSFLDESKIEGLKYVSRYSYDVARNIITWDKGGRIIKGKEEYSILQTLINEKLDKDSVMYNIKISIFWTLYRNRRIFVE